jgi:hypothetical protein
VGDKGPVYQKGWDGEYRPVEGLLGPKQAEVKRDWLTGDPKPATDFLGNQRRTADGSPLYEASSSAEGAAADIAGLVLVPLLILAGLAAVGWLIVNWMLQHVTGILTAILFTIGASILGVAALAVLWRGIRMSPYHSLQRYAFIWLFVGWWEGILFLVLPWSIATFIPDLVQVAESWRSGQAMDFGVGKIVLAIVEWSWYGLLAGPPLIVLAMTPFIIRSRNDPQPASRRPSEQDDDSHEGGRAPRHCANCAAELATGDMICRRCWTEVS